VFFDDPSRIFRLIRFQYVLGFSIAPRAQLQLENALMEGYQNQAPVSVLAAEIRALSRSENAVAGLEAFDRYELLKLISPALTGPALNAAGLGRLERLAHTVLPAEMGGGWLAFLTVLTEKLTAKDKAALLRTLNLPPGEAEELAKLEGQAKKLEAAVKSPRVTRPSHVYEALHRASANEVLMVLYESGQRIVQDRIRAYFSKYLPLSQEITEEQVAATGVKPGTPKFEKALQSMIAAHLNARPKKVVEPEADVAATAPPTAPMVVPRGARK
jgi:tRNA nucleotidyltransferase/poly(A) polymerase